MENFKYKGTSLSFWQLLNDQNIEIPIIQRDYAQGREDKEDLRRNFLNAINDSLLKSDPMRLDFIYGSKGSGSFQPLDGQQRLTTLFLIHWYAALKENNLTEINIKVLKKFSYETRASSREFCQSLVSNEINFNDGNEKLSTLIIDSPWFFLSWKKDPTVNSMLRAIDDIHKIFNGTDDLWAKLTESNRQLSFYYVELKDIGLTDDLYIKMNARGKILSAYENFKASIQKTINEEKWEEIVDFPKTFACKIDTIWTDLFWIHRKDNSIDEALMRFISTVTMVRQSLERKSDRISTISRLQRNPHNVKVEDFSKSGFEYLCKCLDTYYYINSKLIDIDLDFPLWQHAPVKDIFSALVYEDNFSSPQKNSASYTMSFEFI
jgi:uncharacterized protein with ParB-like and HNH nuclease domain